MKVLALVLLCAFAASVQGRSAVKVIENSSSEVELKNNPSLVHLRYAIRTSGFLQTAVGFLISSNWILTASSGVEDASFIWTRFGANYVFQPELVHETSVVRSQGAIALINLTRHVSISDTIAPISLAQWSGEVEGVSYGYGLSASGGPGEYLQSSEVTLEESEDGKLIGSSNILSQYDVGTALVNEDGSQSALLVSVSGTTVEYVKLDEDLLAYVLRETGVAPVPSPPPQPDSAESNSSESNSSESNSSESNNSSESEEDFRVKFVNF